MYVNSHLRHFAKKDYQEKYQDKIKNEFSSTLDKIGVSFENFIKDLNNLERAVFFKLGHLCHYYISWTGCEKCEHQTSHLRFLTCIAVVEVLLGNPTRKKGRVKSKVNPLIVAFLNNNLLRTEKDDLSSRITIRRNSNQIISLTSKLKVFSEIRDGFMHRGELIRVSNRAPSLSLHRSYRGRRKGMLVTNIDLNKFSELKIAIIRYLRKPVNKRKPPMNHSVMIEKNQRNDVNP